MIPRTLVPEGARLSADGAATTRRRPSALDERTLVPSAMPMTKLAATTTIPASLPLESIARQCGISNWLGPLPCPPHCLRNLPWASNFITRMSRLAGMKGGIGAWPSVTKMSPLGAVITSLGDWK